MISYQYVRRFLILCITLLLLAMSGTLLLKTQGDSEAGCPLETAQFTELPRFGHQWASAIDINPAGTVLAVTRADGLWLYDMENLTPLNQPEGVFANSPALAWSPDGTKIAIYIGPQDGIAIYDVWGQEIITTLRTSDHYTANVYTLSWSPDGSKVAAIGTIPWRVGDVDSEKILVEFSNLDMWPESLRLFYGRLSSLLTWSPDSRQVALPDGEDVAIFNVDTWEREKTLPAELYRITSLDWSSNDQLAVAAQDEPIQIWDVQSEQLVYEFPIDGDHFVTKWSNDGQTLAVGGGSLIYLFNAQQKIISNILQGHLSWVYDFVWQSGDEVLISRGRKGSIYSWDIRAAQPIATLISYGEIGKPTWSPDGTKVAIGFREGNRVDFEASIATIRVWDAVTWEILTDLSIDDLTLDLDNLLWSPDGTRLALNSDRIVRIVKIDDGSAILLEENPIEGARLVWSLDSSQIATIEETYSIRIWDVNTGQQEQEFDAHGPIPDLRAAWTDQGLRWLTQDQEKNVRVWEEGRDEPLLTLSSGFQTSSTWLSPSGKYLASSSLGDDGLVQIWDVNNGQLIQTLDAFARELVWTFDEACIATATFNDPNGIRSTKPQIWDVATGELLQTIESQVEGVGKLAWSPDGISIAYIDEVGTVHILSISQNE